MKRMLFAMGILALGLGAGAAFGGSTAAPSPVSAAGDPQVISVLGAGNVGGEKVVVHILAVVQPGADARAVAAQVLRDNNARPFDSSDYSTTGLVWDQFLDPGTANDVVEQHYNSKNQPSASAKSEFAAAQATWNNAGSRFRFSVGADTTRCPSLVRECKRQVFDGYNDVGWLRLGGCCTLAVTWYSTTTDEADMAANTAFRWNFDCTAVSGRYSYQTVMLHELGHVLGLNHSTVSGSTMYATYQAADCTLSVDDMDGVKSLYP